MARQLDDTQVVRPTHFGHAVLRTRNLDEAIAWYETVVGMRVVHRNPFIAFLTYDDEHHRLALVQTGVQEPAPAGAAGLDHLGYTLASLRGCTSSTMYDGSRTITPSLPRHWPAASSTVSPSGKRGVTVSRRNSSHSARDTVPSGVAVPK